MVVLRALRKQHGLTQEGFAELAGMSYKYYQSVETGKQAELRLSTLDRLAKAYGVEGWQLLGPKLPRVCLGKRAKISSPHYRRSRAG